MDLNLNEICRICLKDGPMLELFRINEFQISTKITALTSVEMIPNDGLPENICPQCVSNLEHAWNFREMCCSSNETLLQYTSNLIKLECSQVIYTNELINSSRNILSQSNAGHLHCNYSNNNSNEVHTITEIIANGPYTCSETIADVIEDVIVESQCDDKDQYKSVAPRKRKRYTLPKRIQCHLCGKSCQNEISLSRHARTHQGQSEFECEICHKGFTRSGHLTMHMRTHTGEKPYGCSECQKRFYLSSNLKDHMRLHTGERPFLCPFCAKSFARSSNLAVHVKIHTGEKPFLCSLCGQAFITKGVLQQHMTTHTGEKPFQCDTCMKRFSQSAHLTRHMKIHK